MLNQSFGTTEFALQWDGHKRVYRTQSMDVEVVDEKEVFKFSRGKYGQSIQGVWLEFKISSSYIQLLDDGGGTGNDINDALNALNDASKTVIFYPIHDLDPSVNLQVIRPAGTTKILQVRRTLYSPKASLELLAVDRLDEIPSWLNQTKTL